MADELDDDQLIGEAHEDIVDEEDDDEFGDSDEDEDEADGEDTEA